VGAVVGEGAPGAARSERASRPWLQVSVMGNSTAVWVAPARRDRSDATYSEHLAMELSTNGIDCRVSNVARWNETVPKGLCRFELSVRSAMPDVVILSYGAAEAFPGAFPLSLHTYLHTWHVHSGFGRTHFRNILRRLLWRRLRAWQRLVGTHVGQRTHHVGPRRFQAELGKLLHDIHVDQRALTIVMGIPTASESLCRLVPGMDQRFARYNAIMRQLCEAQPPGSAVFFDMDVLDPATDPVPDSLHLSAEAHRQVGRQLATIVRDWIDSYSGAHYVKPRDT